MKRQNKADVAPALSGQQELNVELAADTPGNRKADCDWRRLEESCKAPSSGQHTPGPWSMVDSQEVHAKTLAEDRLIACCHAGHLAEREANARLITSAPELLAALRACEKSIKDAQANMSADEIDEHWQDQNLRDAAKQARAAIAKAEGREQE